MHAVAFLVDFENAAEVAGKRRVLRGWSDDALRAALSRNRLETMSDPDGSRLRQLLSGSILIRCELARRTADAVLEASVPEASTSGQHCGGSRSTAA